MSSNNKIIPDMGNQILRQFGDRVKKLRKARGWSQEELGDRAKLHRTYIGSIERNERNISLLNIERIAKALKVQIKDLL
jgi:transcriptional regulator with XRE-family HTH domain